MPFFSSCLAHFPPGQAFRDGYAVQNALTAHKLIKNLTGKPARIDQKLPGLEAATLLRQSCQYLEAFLRW